MKSTLIALVTGLLSGGLTYSLTYRPAPAEPPLTEADRTAQRHATAAATRAAVQQEYTSRLTAWKVRHDVRQARIAELQADLTAQTAEKHKTQEHLAWHRLEFPDKETTGDEEHITWLDTQLDKTATELSGLLHAEETDPQPEIMP